MPRLRQLPSTSSLLQLHCHHYQNPTDPPPPEALLYAAPGPVMVDVVAVEVALPPLPEQQPPVPPVAFAVLVASGPGPGPAFATASEPGMPGAPSAPMTVTVSEYEVEVPSTKNEIKERAARHSRECRDKNFLVAIMEGPLCKATGL
jgi:hypothetical protein